MSGELTPIPAPSKITARSLPKYLQKQLIQHMPSLVESLLPALRESIDKREPWAVKAGLEIAGYIKGGNGVTVQQNVIQTNNNVDMGSDRKSFSQLVRRLEERDTIDRGNVVDVQPEG